MSIKSIKYSSLENSIADKQVKKIPVKYLIIAGGGSGARGGNDFGGSQGTGGGEQVDICALCLENFQVQVQPQVTHIK